MKTITHTKDIIARAKSALKCSSDIAFANLLGVSKSTLSNWKKRNSIDYELLFSVCEQIDFNWLLTGEHIPDHQVPSYQAIIRKLSAENDDLKEEVDKVRSETKVIQERDPRDIELLSANKDTIETQKDLIASLKQRIKDLESSSRSHSKSTTFTSVPVVDSNCPSQSGAKPK